MLPRNHPDRIQIAFDDHRLVNNAGLLLPATLAQRVGLRELVDHHLDLGDAPGRANAGDDRKDSTEPRITFRQLGPKWVATDSGSSDMYISPWL